MESLDLDALGIPLGKPEFETSLKVRLLQRMSHTGCLLPRMQQDFEA